MQEIYDLIHQHRSIRKFKDTKVPEAFIIRILEAASRASSSGNMQPYSVIVTEDPEIKRQLFEPHFRQEMVLEAPVIMTFCADFHRMRRWLELSAAPDNFDNFMSFMIGAIDAIMASQNAALAAEAEGLGLCYMGTTLASCLQIAKILKCPENVVPVVGFVMGYPAENPAIRERLPTEAIYHRDVYKSPTDAEVLDVYFEKESSGFERYSAQVDLKGKMNLMGVENLAQIYTKIKYTKKSHMEYSLEVLRCLGQQNFFNHVSESPSMKVPRRPEFSLDQK